MAATWVTTGMDVLEVKVFSAVANDDFLFVAIPVEMDPKCFSHAIFDADL